MEKNTTSQSSQVVLIDGQCNNVLFVALSPPLRQQSISSWVLGEFTISCITHIILFFFHQRSLECLEDCRNYVNIVFDRM